MTPKQRDIVLIPVPFTDLSAQKRRPALVLSTNSHNRKSPDIIVAAITSNLTSAQTGVRITSQEMAEGQLPVDSLVRSDKVYTLSKNIIVKKFGRLDLLAFEQVLKQLDSALGK